MQKGEVTRKRLWSERYPRSYAAIPRGLLIGGFLFCALSNVKQIGPVRLAIFGLGSWFITVGAIISILNIVLKRDLRKRLWSERYLRLYTTILGGLLIGGVLFCVLSGVKQIGPARFALFGWGGLFITVGAIISILNIVSKWAQKKYAN